MLRSSKRHDFISAIVGHVTTSAGHLRFHLFANKSIRCLHIRQMISEIGVRRLWKLAFRYCSHTVYWFVLATNACSSRNVLRSILRHCFISAVVHHLTDQLVEGEAENRSRPVKERCDEGIVACSFCGFDSCCVLDSRLVE